VNNVSHTNQPSSCKQDRYAAIVARTQEHINTAVPEGSTVAIVSKGDEHFLELDRCIGWHFPQNSEGSYSGFYPENDMAAILHLEALRSRGAQFLVVPVTAFWWFDHYSGFDRHLRSLYSVHLGDNDTCTIFDLRSKQALPHPAAVASATPFRNGSLRQLREVVECLVPESSTIAVVSRLDTPGLEMGNRQTWRVGPDPKSQEDDLDTPAISEAARWVQAAMHGGAEFLVLLEPSAWGLDDCAQLITYLPTSARLVTYQAHLCAIFEVRP